MQPTTQKAYNRPMRATAVDGEVVIIADGVSASFTPQAVLDSLENLRAAAEEALVHQVRDSGREQRQSSAERQ